MQGVDEVAVYPDASWAAMTKGLEMNGYDADGDISTMLVQCSNTVDDQARGRADDREGANSTQADVIPLHDD